MPTHPTTDSVRITFQTACSWHDCTLCGKPLGSRDNTYYTMGRVVYDNNPEVFPESIHNDQTLVYPYIYYCMDCLELPDGFKVEESYAANGRVVRPGIDCYKNGDNG